MHGNLREPIKYLDYVIGHAPGYTRMKYQYIHKGYDGLEDRRIGYTNSLEDAIDEINEKEDERN